MNEIQLFNNPEFGEIRTLETNNGDVLFCGKDVATALGYKETAKAIREHCKGVSEMDTPTNGGIQKMKFIPEPDVYRLAFGSKLESAERFTDWVVEVVIPSIRKTGSYTAKPVDELKAKRLEIMERNATARQAMVLVKIAKMGLSQASIECLANGASMLMLGQKILPDPVVEETWSAKEVGKMLGVSGNMIGRLANANGVKCDQYGIRVLDTAKNGKQIPTFRYNKAGVERLRELVSNDE